MTFLAVGKEAWDKDAGQDTAAFLWFKFAGSAFDYTAFGIIGGD